VSLIFAFSKAEASNVSLPIAKFLIKLTNKRPASQIQYLLVGFWNSAITAKDFL
jgi:hypothetical protein